MANPMDTPGGGVDHFVLTDREGPRMMHIRVRIFDICNELVELGTMGPEELQATMSRAAEDPGFAMDYLALIDNPEAANLADVVASSALPDQ